MFIVLTITDTVYLCWCTRLSVLQVHWSQGLCDYQCVEPQENPQEAGGWFSRMCTHYVKCCTPAQGHWV